MKHIFQILASFLIAGILTLAVWLLHAGLSECGELKVKTQMVPGVLFDKKPASNCRR